ncbi:MAG: hypothetical protein WDO73_31350 [Ignavibacteriota bacterium]
MQYPDSGDVEGAWGLLEEQNGDKDTALKHYRTAVALHPAGWSDYWNYARVLDGAGGEIEPRIQALSDALERRPELMDARLLLAQDLCSARRFADALARLQAAPKVEPARAFPMSVGLALASGGLGDRDGARRYAEQAKAIAHTPEEKASADKLLAQIEQNLPGATQERPPSDDPGRPILRRNPPKPPQKKGGGQVD